MLDVLALRLNMPIEVYINEKIENIKRDDVKAMVSQKEFEQCFRDSRSLNLNTNFRTFLRGLNWFRKGLYTNDPIDKFFAFWNSISIVGQKYFRPGEGTTGKGSINQICDCFEQLWGTNENWSLIDKISMHTLRKTFALRYFELLKDDVGEQRALIDLRKQLNHTDVNTTRRYIGLTQSTRKDVFQNFA